MHYLICIFTTRQTRPDHAMYSDQIVRTVT